MRRVLVTGASRGIGAATAHAFAERGDRVALVFRSSGERAQAVLDDLPGTGHVLVRGDVAGEPERIAAEAVRGLGGLDVLINNAAVRGHHPIASVDFDVWQSDWQRILDTNLLGPAHLTFHAARHMMHAGAGGAIVNVSSRGAFRGEPDMPAYGASKAALNALTQSLAIALGPHGIRVAAVAPGFVQTDGTASRLAGPEGDGIRAQSPLGRVATAAEVAEAIVFLAGAEMATGTILDLNGGSYMR